MSIRKNKWVLPVSKPGNDGPIIFSTCDDTYLNYAISLIRSVDLFSPGFSFVLHLINPSISSISQIKKLKNNLNKTALALSVEEIDLSELSEKERVAYYACARFHKLTSLLEQVATPIFSLDADTLVVNSIDKKFSDKEKADVVLVKRNLKEDKPDHLAVATGSIWFNSNYQTLCFLQNISKKIDDLLVSRKLRWFADQIVFFECMQQSVQDLRIYNLKSKYADWEYRVSSIVWAGKGERKVNDMRFFLLQSVLSNDPDYQELAIKIWDSFKAKKNQLAFNSWFVSRFKTSIKSNAIIAIYLPRLDLSWKKDKTVNSASELSDEMLELRMFWKRFTTKLANELEQLNVNVEIHELPAWRIRRSTIEASGASMAMIPHACIFDFENGNTPVMFYMQEYYPWMFVVDRNGWSAASSQYPIQYNVSADELADSFILYRQRLLEGHLTSKFPQNKKSKTRKLIEDGSIPFIRNFLGFRIVRPYIFLPLQIPHDQSIQYFSDVSMLELVEYLSAWANKNSIAVIMKPHPANMKAMEQFRCFVDNRNIFWSEAHIHDLIFHATAVYTINSGVGFESLLHIKPVVTFGKVEYDCVTHNAKLSDLDNAWKYCLDKYKLNLENRYREFFNWFVNKYVIDLSQKELSSLRIKDLAGTIAEEINRN